jgi:hypothetical protein
MEYGKLFYLRINPGLSRFELLGGGPLVAVDIGSASVPYYVEHHGVPSFDGPCVWLKGTALRGNVVSGYVGLGYWPGDVCTLANGQTSTISGGTVWIGAAVTQTGHTWRAGGSNLTVYCHASLPTGHVFGGAVWHQLTAGWTAMSVYKGSTVYAHAGVTYATTNLYDNAVVETVGHASKIFSTTNIYGTDVRRVYHPATTTWTTVNWNVGAVP